ncbi:MAG: cation diffusion facilitator family transporter [Clostridium sp.]|jgi:cation diffusion facilitator family transporter|uniref:cation diffusion facilitator family transporter n=1 Tax=Clostridium sp. TaxID=1506 RepID=UPI0025C20ABD|nr:cation diffusion facilitator family transporter [Clostridium sp.]MCH3962786.1 cation diffusion facilitator family transporter [Clostridium sp.]MCI1715799.1 cation diffusion facilitator family transporter [Clostridium sp.]MCI1799996.1 cation diffusion facilitator family transporter [Clostridium sp.]MCI1813910.1 cation diffusion facilitator family transporter [Clostridium sp.]MCI1870808.1 cation diffusion facilitator family transporter [Clostridium sp.]
MNKKTMAACLSILSNSSLIIMKLIVGTITGSVSIISEAVHSTIDLTASLVSFFSVRISSKPADIEHPYGHGKFEDVSGVFEGMLILIVSIWIIFEAADRLFHPVNTHQSAIGFTVMFISSGINFLVSRKLYKVAEKEDSMALKADALHLKTDVYTSLGIALGLLLIWVTKLEVLDPLIAIAVSIFILKEAFNLLKSAFNPLVDVKLSDDEILTIKNIISRYNSVFCGFHRLRTRKSGDRRYIDLHLVFPQDMHVKAAHDICDKIENKLSKSLKNTETMIHIESCDNDCNNCNLKERLNCIDTIKK